MPKISAPTVAEHRAEQIRAILDAAHDLMKEGGALPAMGQVAARAGLARPSIYQYFPSRNDLLIALTEDMTPRWLEKVTADMDAHSAPADRILIYLEANIRMVAAGDHAAGDALAAEPGVRELFDEHVRALHARLLEPLVHELERLGVAEATPVAMLLNAQLHAATGMLSRGTPADEVVRLLRDVVEPYLRTR